MNPNANHARLARLQRECDISVVPAVLLCAACALLVFVLGVYALLYEANLPQAGEPTQQALPPGV